MSKLLLSLMLLCSVSFTFAQKVTTYAGKNKTSGTTSNGAGTGAVRFNQPWGMAYDRQGNLWVTNEGSHAIFMLRATDNKFYVRAGKQGQRGYNDAGGINAQFDQPKGIAIGLDKIYVADPGNHCIRQMDTFKALGTLQNVSLLAGKKGKSGHNDATGSSAEFDTPTDVAVDSKGNIYVADQGNHCIRKVTTGGVVTTFAGQAGSSGSANGDKDTKAKFNWPTGLFIDASDNIYVADKNNSRIRKIDAKSGSVSTVYITAQSQTPEQVYVINGTIISSGSCQIQAYDGKDTMFVGNHPRNCGFKNDEDTNALLDDARAILPVSNTEFIFADRDNHVIRKIEIDVCDAFSAAITAGGATKFCDGGDVTLSSNPLYSNTWTWKTGSSTKSSITATTKGYYTLESTVMIGGETCTDSTGVYVNVFDNPTPTITTTGNLTFCPGDSVKLSADQQYKTHKWSVSTTNDQDIYVKTATTVDLDVVDANGCEGSATPVITLHHNVIDPVVTAKGATEFCDGGSVDLESSGGFSSYDWSNGGTGQTITANKDGDYTVTATDINGCKTSSNGVKVTVYPLPAKPDLNSMSDSLYTNATATEYIWYYEGSEVSRTTVAYYIVTQDGKYEVEVVDGNGCMNKSDIEDVKIIGLDKPSTDIGKIYPNPSTGVFHIPANMQRNTFTVLDLTGKTVKRGTLHQSLDLSDLNNGTYLIRISNAEEFHTSRLIINR